MTTGYYNDNFSRYVGYAASNVDTGVNQCVAYFFSQNTVNLISHKVTQLLRGFTREEIKIPDSEIIAIMNSVQQSYRPPTGDIFTRYIIPSGLSEADYVQNMIDQTIEILTSQTRAQIDMDTQNKNLSIWNSVYGEHNSQGLRQHSQIKIRERRPITFQFNMNY